MANGEISSGIVASIHAVPDMLPRFISVSPNGQSKVHWLTIIEPHPAFGDAVNVPNNHYKDREEADQHEHQ